MEFNDVLPFLQENHMAVVTTVGSAGRSQATVANAGPYEGQVVFVSRDHTVKIKNVLKSGRCAVTVLRPETGRYVTVEGPARVHGWDDTAPEALLALLRNAYTATGRPPERWADFDGTMREERRTVVLVSPDRVYGSLERSRP